MARNGVSQGRHSKEKEKVKRKEQRIARAVLAGLAAGSMTGMLTANDASAMTLDEYKQALAEGKVFVDYRETNDAGTPSRVTVNRLNQEGIKQARVVGQGWISVDLADGDKANAMELRTSDKNIDANGNVTVSNEGGEMTFSFGADYEKIAANDPSGLKDTTAVADMTNVIFKADRGGFHHYNGTIIARPENIYGGQGHGDFDIGARPEDNPDEIGTALEKTHATLKLVADSDSKFNGDWQDEAGNPYFGSRFIHVNKTGTLEVPSSLIFQKGLGDDGKQENPEAMRDDAQNALDFNGGTLALDDLRHNDEYLLKVSDLFKHRNITIRTVNGEKRSIVHVATQRLVGEGGLQPWLRSYFQHEHFTASDIKKDGILRIRNLGYSWTTLDLKDGDKIKPLDLAVGAGAGPDGSEGGSITLNFGSPDWRTGSDAIKSTAKDSDAVADLKDVTFHLESGNIDLINGTIEVEPKNFKSGQGRFNVMVEPGDIGAPGNTFKYGTGMQTHATLHMVGDSDFQEKAAGNKAPIQLNPNGTLMGKSKLFFAKGLTAAGTNENPESLRKNFTDNVTINGGRLVLDDSFYNDVYLEKAKGLIQAQSPNATVEMWNGARKSLQYAQWSDALGTDAAASSAPPAAHTTEQNIQTAAGKTHHIQTVDFTDATKPHKITVANGSVLNLGYKDASGDFITVSGDTPSDDVTTSVSVDVESGGTLTLGRGDKSLIGNTNADIALAASGAEAADAKAKLEIASGQQTVRSIKAGDNTSVTVDADALLQAKKGITLEKNAVLDVEGSVFDTSAAEMKTGASLAVNGRMTGTKITVAADASDVKITVGNNDKAGTLILPEGSVLTKAEVFLDPVWKDGVGIEGASKFVNPSDTIDYRLTVGRNSVASIGVGNEETADAALRQAGKSWGTAGITAALYLGKHLTVDANGGIKVDGSLATGASAGELATAGNITFGENSLLAADAAAFTGTSSSLITGTGTTVISVNPKSYLQLTGILAEGSEYHIIDGTTATTDAAVNNWLTKPSRDNVILPKNYQFSAEAADAGKLIFKRVPAAEAMPQINRAASNIIDAVSAATSSTSPYYAGARAFVADVTNARYSDELRAAAANAAMQPLEAVGASYMATRAVIDLASAAQQRLSLLNTDEKAEPQNFWLKYGHSRLDVDGLALEGGRANYDGKYNSITVGYNFAPAKKTRGGVAFSYVKGSSSGSYGLNDLRMGGISAYAGIRNGNNNLLMDAGVYKAANDADSFVSADADINIVTFGITDEMRIESGNQAIVPHIGLRWTNVDMEAYDGVWGEQKAFHYDPSRKSLVTLPVGVGFQSVSKTKDWTQKFYADLSYIATLGGKESNLRVSVPGIDGAAGTVHYDIYDRSTIVGSLGMNAESKTMSWDLGYQYRHSSDSNSHNIMAQLNFRF